MSFASQRAHVLHAIMFFFALLDAQSSIAAANQIEQRISRLETGVRAEEAIRAVKRLQHTYAHCLDFALRPDFSDPLTQNAVGQSPTGTTTGKENLGKHFMEQDGRRALRRVNSIRI
jgi:hypothetical protein